MGRALCSRATEQEDRCDVSLSGDDAAALAAPVAWWSQTALKGSKDETIPLIHNSDLTWPIWSVRI